MPTAKLWMRNKNYTLAAAGAYNKNHESIHAAPTNYSFELLVNDMGLIAPENDGARLLDFALENCKHNFSTHGILVRRDGYFGEAIRVHRNFEKSISLQQHDLIVSI